VVALGDRDCSVQRRYQKLVEEAPAPGLAGPLRSRIHAAAVAFGTSLGYRGAGTVEFLVAGDEFYFLEMNARIQVEHPVTEAVYGVDLVAEQLAITEGRPVSVFQQPSGHAIECRINAEDRDFVPSPGTVGEAWFPAGPGIRVDTHLQAGAAVPPYYDSLVAKLVAHGRDRAQALTRLAAALPRCRITGIATNLDLHAAVLAADEFRAGGVDTGWLARFLGERVGVSG
jgi:acetyl-CoA carboxylase biotin carboxylase subunit